MAGVARRSTRRLESCRANMAGRWWRRWQAFTAHQRAGMPFQTDPAETFATVALRQNHTFRLEGARGSAATCVPLRPLAPPFKIVMSKQTCQKRYSTRTVSTEEPAPAKRRERAARSGRPRAAVRGCSSANASADAAGGTVP